MKAIKSPTDLSRKEVDTILTNACFDYWLTDYQVFKVIWWWFFNFNKVRYYALKIKHGMTPDLAFIYVQENFKQLRGK